MTEQHAQRSANPFAKFGNQPYRMGGEKTPATTNPVTSVCSALRITVERGKGYQSYRFLAAGSFVYFPVDLNELFKPLVGDLRPEDDMKVNWSVTWFMNAQARRIVTKITDTTTGEILAQSDAQPALIETTVDEKTGQLTTEKSGSPFGRLGLPAETIEKARIRGEELRAEREKKEAEMAKTDDTANAALQNTLATAEAEQTASADITPEPDKAKTVEEITEHKPATENDWAGDDEKFAVFVTHLRALAKKYGVDPDYSTVEGLQVVKVKTWYEYKGKANDALKAIEAAWKPAEPPETKEPSKTGANDSAGSVEPPIANAAPVAPKKADSVEPTKSADVIIEKLSDDEPRPIEMITTVNPTTGEIVVFDPERALNTTKAKSALVNRLVTDNVLVKGVDYGEVPGTDKATLLKPGAEKLLSAFQLYDKFTDVAIERNWKEGFFFYEYECTLYDRESGKAIGSGIGSCNSMEKKYRFRWVTKDRVPKTLNLEDLPSRGGKISEFDFAVDKAETSGKYGKPAEYWQQFKSAVANGTAVTIDRKDSKGTPRKAIEIDSTMYGIPNEDIFDLVNTISKMAQKRALVAAALNATGASAVFSQDLEDFTDFGLIEAA